MRRGLGFEPCEEVLGPAVYQGIFRVGMHHLIVKVLRPFPERIA